MSSQLHLPPELLDKIVEFVDKPADLRSLALSARIFHSIIFPHHIKNREIRAYARDARVWERLLKHPCRASYVRVLEIIPETVGLTCGKPPAILNAYSRILGAQLLGLALPLMTNLRRFIWEDSTLGNRTLDTVIQAINNSPMQLQELSLNGLDWSGFYGDLRFPPSMVPFSPDSLAGLKRCTIDFSVNSALNPQPALKWIFGNAATSLTHLYIKAPPKSSTFELFSKCYWPILRKLTLHMEIYWDTEPHDDLTRHHIVTDFFKRHAQLGALRVVGPLSTMLTVSLPANTMIKLRTLEFDNLSFEEGSNCLPRDIMERLWYTPFRFTLSSWSHLVQMKSLRFCMFSDPNPKSLEKLYQVAPQLERLWYNPLPYIRNEPSRKNLELEIVSALSKFEILTHLAFFGQFYWYNREAEFCQIPNLVYLQTEKGWIELVRDNAGYYLTHRYLVDSKYVEVSAWGGFYTGQWALGGVLGKQNLVEISMVTRVAIHVQDHDHWSNWTLNSGHENSLKMQRKIT